MKQEGPSFVGSSGPAGTVLPNILCVLIGSCDWALVNRKLVAVISTIYENLCRIVRFSKQEYGMPNKFEFSENYIPHTYTKKWFTVYLKIKYNWASCIVSSSPVFMQDHLSLLLMVVPRQISKPHWICKILSSVWTPDLLWEVELSSCHTLHCIQAKKLTPTVFSHGEFSIYLF